MPKDTLNQDPQAKEPTTVYVGKKPEESEYNVDIIVDYDGSIDLFHLNNKDPNYEYRFLRAIDDNLSIKTGNLLFAKGGWQIVPKKHLLEKLKIEEKRLHPDGTLRRGDVILAFMPKELYKKKLAYKQEKADSPMKQIKRLLKEGDKNVERGIHGTMEGLQTGKQLGMK